MFHYYFANPGLAYHIFSYKHNRKLAVQGDSRPGRDICLVWGNKSGQCLLSETGTYLDKYDHMMRMLRHLSKSDTVSVYL